MSPLKASPSSVFQAFLDDAVANEVGPGFQCVIFDRESLLFNGVSGYATAPSEIAPEGVAFKPETLIWIASCTKISLSLVVLHLIERGLTKSGFSIKDLDNHEALIEVLPEFKHDSGSIVTKVIEGFEDEVGKDGKKIMKLRDAKGRMTLRMLLTHTAGMPIYWAHPLMTELYRPSDDSIPHATFPFMTGDISDFQVPLMDEPGTVYAYGCSADWLGQFAVRSSGKHLRQLFKEILFDPLHLPPSEADIWISPSLSENQAAIHVRGPDKGFVKLTLPVYSSEHAPPEGKAQCAAGGICASMQAYSKVLQAVLIQDPRILSPEVWQMAVKDELKDQGISIPKPEWKSYMPDMSQDLEVYAKSTSEDGTGANLLQCKVANAPTVSGRSAGSFGWAGFANTYYFIDPVKGVGAILGCQLLPFLAPEVIEMRDHLEALIYQTLFPINN